MRRGNNLKLVTGDEGSPAPTRDQERGVQEVVLRADDWRGFELIDSTGSCIMYVEWPTERVTQADVDDLWRTLDEMDPPDSAGPRIRP